MKAVVLRGSGRRPPRGRSGSRPAGGDGRDRPRRRRCHLRRRPLRRCTADARLRVRDHPRPRVRGRSSSRSGSAVTSIQRGPARREHEPRRGRHVRSLPRRPRDPVLGTGALRLLRRLPAPRRSTGRARPRSARRHGALRAALTRCPTRRPSSSPTTCRPRTTRSSAAR